MMAALICGTAPDGSPVSTEADAGGRGDEDMCPARYGPPGSVQAWCTEAKDHPGPWHIATTGTEIVRVWPMREEGSGADG
jgi:hypothetical protein